MAEFSSEYARDKSGQGRLLKAKFSVRLTSFLIAFDVFFSNSTLLCTLFLMHRLLIPAWMRCWRSKASGVWLLRACATALLR